MQDYFDLEMQHEGNKALMDATSLWYIYDSKMTSSMEAEKRIKESTGFLDPTQRNFKHTRIGWDSYFMSLAFLVAMRSPDAQTQHGSVIVDKKKRIISTGYNGFLPGAIDALTPNIRPKKYQHIIHSEVNAILAAKQDISDCEIYVTGLPCNECLKLIAASGIKHIIVGDRPHVFAEGHLELMSLICATHNIEITRFEGELANMPGRTISKRDHFYES